jgi:NADPH-dependent curcumin reductase CurA
MSELAVKQIVLASRLKGLPSYENFRLEEAPMPELPQGGLLLRVLYLSLDPLYARPHGRPQIVREAGRHQEGPRPRVKRAR